MLVYHSKLLGTPVLSVQSGAAIGHISAIIINPNDLKAIAFRLEGPLINRTQNILDVRSVREYSNFGMIIDDIDELITADDVVKIADILKLNFDLTRLKVETKKGSKLGKIIDYTLTSDDFLTQQLVVKRPAIKSFLDPELIVPRKEIIEVTDYKVIVKDEEKTIKKRATQEDFVPNFVNPFRDPGFASTDTDTINNQSKS